jgi:preprotein translocase subunit SecG
MGRPSKPDELFRTGSARPQFYQECTERGREVQRDLTVRIGGAGWHGSSISASAARAFPVKPWWWSRPPEQTLERTVSVMITVITVVMITFALAMITEATDAHAKQAKKAEAEREACEIRRSPIASRRPMTEAA